MAKTDALVTLIAMLCAFSDIKVLVTGLGNDTVALAEAALCGAMASVSERGEGIVGLTPVY